MACSKLGVCQTATLERVSTSYTCVLFDPASEPVFAARWEAMQQVGERAAIKAMLKKKPTPEDEDARSDV